MNFQSFLWRAWTDVHWLPRKGKWHMKQQQMRFVNITEVPPILGRVVTPNLTFSSLLAESGLHGQQGGVHIHRELTNCMIYTYWLPPAVTIARAKARHA